MTSADPLLSELASFGLEMTRVAGLVMVAPFPWESAPKRVKGAIVIFLAFLAHGAASVAPFPGPVAVMTSVVGEMVAGLGMGLVVRLSVGVAEVAGGLLAPVMGISAAQMFDPGTGETDSILTRFFRLLALLLFTVAGAHRAVLGALLRSFKEVPVGAIAHPEAGAALILTYSAQMLESGVRIALPVVAVLTMCQIALAFVSRAAPAIQVFSVGFAVLLAVGGISMRIALPDTARELLEDAEKIEPRLEEFMLEIAGL
jgi:flagellar biosynthesis protein FliR